MHNATVGNGAQVSNTSGPSSAETTVKSAATRTIAIALHRKNDADRAGSGMSFQNGCGWVDGAVATPPIRSAASELARIASEKKH